MIINWSRNKATIEVEAAIARRALNAAAKLDIRYSQMDAVMDIDACHSNGNPLKLRELLEADDSNFAHDVFGIRAHIDRSTGKLNDCFIPRYSL